MNKAGESSCLCEAYILMRGNRSHTDDKNFYNIYDLWRCKCWAKRISEENKRTDRRIAI